MVAHRFLHQYPVHQLVQPLFTIVNLDHIRFGGGAGGWIGAYARRENGAEAREQVGDGPLRPRWERGSSHDASATWAMAMCLLSRKPRRETRKPGRFSAQAPKAFRAGELE